MSNQEYRANERERQDVRYRFPLTRDAWSAIGDVLDYTRFVDDALQKVLNLDQKASRPHGFAYAPPPFPGDLPQIAQSREERRAAIPHMWRGWYNLFDEYHRSLHDWRGRIKRAVRVLADAASEIDGDEQIPLRMRSQRVLRELMNLDGSIGSPLMSGWDPAVNRENGLTQMRAAKQCLSSSLIELETMAKTSVPRRPALAQESIAGESNRSYRYPLIYAVLTEVVSVKERTKVLIEEMDRVIRFTAQFPTPADFDYDAPPEAWHDTESVDHRERIAAVRPARHEDRARLYDRYHTARIVWAKSIWKARRAVQTGIPELDLGIQSAFEQPSNQLTSLLDDLRSSVIDHGLAGPSPACNSERNLNLLRERLKRLTEWEKKLWEPGNQLAAPIEQKAISAPQAPVPPAHSTQDQAAPTDAPKTPPASSSTTTFIFRRDGDLWHVVFEGVGGRFPNLNAMRYIMMLLSQPNPVKPLAALALMGLDTDVNRVQGSFQPIESEEARREIREQLADINREIDEARAIKDEPKIRQLEDEQREILAQHDRDTGPQGRDRNLAQTSPAESARVAVKRAMGRVYGKFHRSDPSLVALAVHLEASIVTEGQSYAYRPLPPAPAWRL